MLAARILQTWCSGIPSPLVAVPGRSGLGNPAAHGHQSACRSKNRPGQHNQIFDKEKEQKRIQQAQLIGEISTQVSDIVRTQGAIKAAQDAKEKMGNISQQDRDKARADWMKAHPGKTPDEKAINGQVYQNFYDKAFNATGLGTGGAVQQAIQAATAAVQGLAGGDVAAALANGAAPYLAEVIGHRMGIDNNPQAKAIAHAIVGAALAAAQGQNAAAGATGAALGEITAGILKDQLYGKDTPVSDLTETQKQTLSALATLSSGLAGGLVADSTGSAVYAAQAGKTTAENNHLNTIEKITLTSKEKEYAASCSGENAGNSACTGLKQDIDKLHEKGQSIDKKEASELGPDFQLGGVDSIEHNPGDVVSCVNSSNGFCVVTEKTAANGREWMLAPADEIQAIAAKTQNGKTEDFIKELGAAYLEAGCGMPGVASALCQTYSAAGGANPISGRVPTDAERVTWAMQAAANVASGIIVQKSASIGKGTVQVKNLGNVDDFLASQAKNLNKKLGAKIGEGRLPYEAGKAGVDLAKKTIRETLENATQISAKIPSSSVRGQYDLIHIYSSKTNSTVSLRILPDGKYDFDTLIPEKSSKF